jgi:hypothetical protein
LLQGNYEFGISRIIKSLEPYNKKLETDTWRVAAHMTCLMPTSCHCLPQVYYDLVHFPCIAGSMPSVASWH